MVNGWTLSVGARCGTPDFGISSREPGLLKAIAGWVALIWVKLSGGRLSAMELTGIKARPERVCEG